MSSDRDTEREEAARAAQAFLARLGTRFPAYGARLFGSRARGDHRSTSDADLAVLIDGDPPTHREYVDVKLVMADLAFDSLLESGLLISPLPIWRSEWEGTRSHLNPRLLDNIRREGVPV